MAVFLDIDATVDSHDVSRCRAEVVVPRFRGGPLLVVLQQVPVHEHSQLGHMTERRHITFSFGNSWVVQSTNFPAFHLRYSGSGVVDCPADNDLRRDAKTR
jgi:hypothetical protein